MIANCRVGLNGRLGGSFLPLAHIQYEHHTRLAITQSIQNIVAQFRLITSYLLERLQLL